jgi:hypothetical protein
MGKIFRFLSFAMLILCGCVAVAQQTIVRGKITDSKTGEALPYVNISTTGRSLIGTMSASDGSYILEVTVKSDSIAYQFVGYKKVRKHIRQGTMNVINVKLDPETTTLKEATITAKKEKYSRKNNPAVELIENVQKHKDANNIANNDYYQYKRHEKNELAISNINDSIRNKAPYKKIDFLFDNLQMSSLSGKNYLPVYFMETLSDNYYRRSSNSKKKMVIAQKDVEISQFLDQQSIEFTLKEIFGDIDIYNDNIKLLSNEFLSPLGDTKATHFYQFFLNDTVLFKGDSCIVMSFNPANLRDIGFSGKLWITKDTNYAVKKIILNLPKNSGINFVSDMFVTQEYTKDAGHWRISEDNIEIECNMYGVKIHGRKNSTYADFVYNTPMEENFYNSFDLTQRVDNYNKRSLTYWDANRIAKLTPSEQMTYDNSNKLNNIVFYKALLNTIMAFASGYVDLGKFDYGPVENTVSWNSIEGVRLRVGGKTNINFNKHIFLDGFLAYSTKGEYNYTKDDQDYHQIYDRWKYALSVMYNFANKKYHQWEFPKNLLTVGYESNTDIQGQKLLMGTADRLFLSFNRGDIDKMTFNHRAFVEYEYETVSQFSLRAKLQHLEQQPLAKLTFVSYDGKTTYDPLKTTTAEVELRYAKGEQFLQIQRYRLPMNSTTPIYSLTYTYGSKLMGGDFEFHKLVAAFQKRSYLLPFGFADFDISAGKIFGKVPYPLLTVAHANQNWAYQDEAFNLMNYFEFVSQDYFQFIFNYNCNGYIFNRIPLIRALKWREVFAVKALWGQVEKENNPVYHQELMAYPKGTYSLNNVPYVEANVGIDNIFNVLRIDYVRRFTYLDNLGISKWGIRFRLRFTF